MTNDQITHYLESKKIVQETNWQNERVDRVNLQRKSLSAENNNLLLILLDLSSELSEYKDWNERSKKRWDVLKKSKLNEENPWDGKSKEMLTVMFGEHANYIAHGWLKITEGMYQSGYARRSFRLPKEKGKYFHNQINWIYNLWGEWKYNLTLEEYAKYGNHIGDHNFSYLYAAAIDYDHPTLLKSLLDILQGDAEVGTVSRSIIKGLLLSNKKEAWEAVKNLLLAAQRQEGLRQVILECLDETSTGALIYLLEVVLEEDLLRFSSVVRSLDVWTGMNWESERKSAIKTALNFGLQYLKEPATIEEGVLSKNNVQVYMALWAQGVFDVKKCYPFLTELVEKGTQEKRNIALYFASQTDLSEANTELVTSLRNSGSLWDMYWVGQLIHIDDFKEAHELYESLYSKLPEKEKTLSNKGFEWIIAKVGKNSITSQWIGNAERNEENLRLIFPFTSEFDLEGREHFARSVFGEFYQYSYQNKKIEAVPSYFQKEMALTFIEDRSSIIQRASAKVLEKATIHDPEIPVLEEILRKKSAALRKGVLGILIKLEDDKVLKTIQSLAASKVKNKRLAALDLMKQLHQQNRVLDKVAEEAKNYKELYATTPDEELILKDLLQEKTNYSAENGWGLYNPKELLAITLPEINTTHNFHQRIFTTKRGLFSRKKSNSGFSMPVDKVLERLEELDALIEKHKDVEFEAINYAGNKETYLVGNTLLHTKTRRKGNNEKEYSDEEWYHLFPLAQVWKDWFDNSNLDALDLCYLSHYAGYNRIDKKSNPKWVIDISEKYSYQMITKYDYENKPKFKYQFQMEYIFETLQVLHKQNDSSYWLEGAIAICNEYPEKELNKGIVTRNNYSTSRFTSLFTDLPFFSNYYTSIKANDLSDKDLMRLYQLELWIGSKVYRQQRNNSYRFCEYFNRLQLPEADKMYYLVNADMLGQLTDSKKYKHNHHDWRLLSPKLNESGYIEKVVDRILEIELTRGESDTEVSFLARVIKEIKGTDYLVQCIEALGKDTLETGYSYGSMSKKSMMSQLLSNTVPASDDTQEKFNEKIQKTKLTEKRLIEVAMYAPQWQKFVQSYLKWEGLESAIWWLHAHSSQYLTAQKETEIARYSSIPIEEFNQGAVDVHWFNSIYKVLGKPRWKLVYNAAKYISYGNGHTLAKLYADVILKEVKITEVTKRVKEKRNQNYLRVYGLVPLSKTVPQKDVLKRYNYLQQFLKESKQFGSQRQESEKLAVQIAMDNLARNAGYTDPIRLTWSMESLQAQQLLSNAQELVFDEVKIWLEVDDEGKSNILVTKKGKKLKSIPAKLRKDKEVLKLKEFNKKLIEQYRRTRKSLELAMVYQDEFTLEEIEGLSNHPVVKPMLEKLVLKSSTGNLGIWKNKVLNGVDENVYEESPKQLFYIAHCTDLYKSKKWTAWQRYFFQNEWKQPFKQVYRELYALTPDEEREGVISKRYAGHQVQPKKTLALLKGRGWTVDYDNGLQKVIHKHHIIVELNAMADWFSPADVENPTLETIRFYHKKEYKSIPLSKVPEHVFSEVMRDVDLVVSVAHAGGVDPEASLSTVVLRKVIAEESAKLFKLKNVAFKERHVLIEGTHANYSLHLGSGVVHVQPGGYISIIPVHSQHRGRIFLPFVDEDPKTAEIVSKMLLLAEDDKLKDPTILRQLIGTLV
ncbi:protein of unknown function [Tenacibaculum sp. MAR_2009_124]|uniref:DUF4132 domain-containing protein n=1 Tax=Tenacibaculum sp. MAR_2009_124 TaxID=1250059 RepID=UPI0008987010|nr:DUF4132 domain-containing protein [Tenacibaculum sp. MAR_2009_124]SEC77305.1 protein of unknown function [Tenacibaculum sp. MAR_2009_124]